MKGVILPQGFGNACSWHPQVTISARRKNSRIVTNSQGGRVPGFLQGIQDLLKVKDGSSQSSPKAPLFPPYSLITRGKGYDIRLYNVYPVVEMDYSRREVGYALLGGYIDGDNEKKMKFTYTQPTVMRYPPKGEKSMQMFVSTPRGSASSEIPAASSLPAPLYPEIRVAVAGGEVVAVLQFEGAILPNTAEAARRQLIACLQRDGINLAEEEEEGLFRVGQYGALNSLMPRLNELMLRVKP